MRCGGARELVLLKKKHRSIQIQFSVSHLEGGGGGSNGIEEGAAAAGALIGGRPVLLKLTPALFTCWSRLIPGYFFAF